MSRMERFRLRRRLGDLTAWLTSANGDHRPEVDAVARQEITHLLTLLG